MAPIIPNPKKVKTFRTETAFATWLGANHAREKEVWLKIYKKGSGLLTVTPAQALDVALCWGWIDGIRKALDECSFLQRFSPRTPRSVWSQINREHVARLIAAGRMTPHGQRVVDAAKADGRWDAAYAPIRSATPATIPDDLRAAIETNPRARKTFRTLGRLNLFALAFRTNRMRTPAGRARMIARLVATLARGETIVPERRRAPMSAKRGKTMVPRRVVSSVVLVCIALLLSPSSSEACSCVETPKTSAQLAADFRAEYGRAFAIFTGRVVGTTMYDATFEVQQVWKGDVRERVTLQMSSRAADPNVASVSSCDYRFERAREYLVFAYGTAVAMKAEQCTPTNELRFAHDALERLKSIASPRPPGLR